MVWHIGLSTSVGEFLEFDRSVEPEHESEQAFDKQILKLNERYRVPKHFKIVVAS